MYSTEYVLQNLILSRLEKMYCQCPNQLKMTRHKEILQNHRGQAEVVLVKLKTKLYRTSFQNLKQTK